MFNRMGLEDPSPPSTLIDSLLKVHGLTKNRQRMNAANPQVGEPMFNPASGLPGVGGGPQQQQPDTSGRTTGWDRPDININFERDFGQWFNNPDDDVKADSSGTAGGDINFERDFGQWFINPDTDVIANSSRTTGRDDCDINFERDFGQWFINPDDNAIKPEPNLGINIERDFAQWMNNRDTNVNPEPDDLGTNFEKDFAQWLNNPDGNVKDDSFRPTGPSNFEKDFMQWLNNGKY